jgi:hypothetical protein
MATRYRIIKSMWYDGSSKYEVQYRVWPFWHYALACSHEEDARRYVHNARSREAHAKDKGNVIYDTKYNT